MKKLFLRFLSVLSPLLLPSLALAQALPEAAEAGSEAQATIGSLVQVSLGFLAVIATIVILTGGFKWATASGNDDAEQEAKTLVFSGSIALAIIASAWVITLYVLQSLTGANI